ncbi:MAG: hypothetical protein ACI8PZ_005342 [Myxococcota bacterium]|jgi:hypothetical protein
MAIEVRPVELPGDIARFCKSWWPIYADDPQWVPPLIFERKDFLNPSVNPYFKHADVQLWMAFRDGKIVGTISAQVDHELQEHEPGIGMFGFFEFVNDVEVARALFDTACAWLGERGMKVARGPFNFNTNHEFGLLVDGFDTPPMIANPHNRDYYSTVYEALGMESAKDWYAYWLDYAKQPPDLITRMAERFMKRSKQLTIRTLDMSRYDEEVKLFLAIYNDAWEDNWGHVRVTDEEFLWMAKGLKEIIDPSLCFFAFMGDDVAAAAITLPDYNQVVKKMNGGLFPFGWWHWLTGRKKIDAVRVWVLGVKKEYQRLPLGAPLYLKTWQEGARRNIRGAEASLILHDNHRMRGAIEKLGARIYKTYRTYERSLD